MSKKKDNLYLFIIIGGALLLVGALLWGNIGSIGGGTSNNKKVVCDVNIDNDFFFNADIKSASCTSSSGCGLFSVSTLGIFSDNLGVEFVAGGKTASKSVGSSKIPFSDKVVILSLCVDQSVNSGSIRLIKDGSLDDSLQVSF